MALHADVLELCHFQYLGVFIVSRASFFTDTYNGLLSFQELTGTFPSFRLLSAFPRGSLKPWKRNPQPLTSTGSFLPVSIGLAVSLGWTLTSFYNISKQQLSKFMHLFPRRRQPVRHSPRAVRILTELGLVSKPKSTFPVAQLSSRRFLISISITASVQHGLAVKLRALVLPSSPNCSFRIYLLCSGCSFSLWTCIISYINLILDWL